MSPWQHSKVLTNKAFGMQISKAYSMVGQIKAIYVPIIRLRLPPRCIMPTQRKFPSLALANVQMNPVLLRSNALDAEHNFKIFAVLFLWESLSIDME
ncbi:hypothetical protein GGH13_003636 [Coemansia sp. S155-1]|nr:hypothetical protein GGH13_003636 [Coemansia sp. S155-1]